MIRLRSCGSAAAFVAAALGLSLSAQGGQQSPPRPNIVLLMADDLGWGDVGYQGHPRLRTPNLDAMAARGLRFDRFYAAAPVCSPTRGSCLTGRHPSRYGIEGANSGHLRAGEVQLAGLLRGMGYRTGHFGKWHLGTLTVTERDSNRGGPRGAAHFAPPWERSFDTCFSTEAKVPTWNPMRRPGRPEEPYGTAYWTGPGVKADSGLEGDDSRILMDHVLPFVRQAARDGDPFLAVVWFHAPHEPVIAGPEHLALYADVSDAKARHYFGCVTALDEQVGRLCATLRELEVADDTVVWFCSDNGPEHRAGPGSAGPLRGRKRDLYEGGIRVPAVLDWPAGIERPAVVSTPVGTSDILPTLLDVVGARLPDFRPLDGVSVRPSFAREDWVRPRPLHFASKKKLARIETRFKLIRPRGDVGFELYDIVADPAEAVDLAERQPDRVSRMSAALGAWQASCRKSAQGFDLEQPPPDANDYFELRGTAALARCRRAFSRGAGRVAFLGGSITHNAGWRDLVCDDLRWRFPQTEFDFINAGIPSFGSTPGAFRVARDAFARGPVDLLFVEAAVNDAANGRSDVEQIRAMEGVVRQALRHQPQIDIVMLHFVDPGKMQTLRAGRQPDVIRNHERVADHYRLPSIDLAREVTERIDAGQFDWENDFRNLHPSPFGQGIYARAIRRLFDVAWRGAPPAAGDRVLPPPLDRRCYEHGALLPIETAELGDGFRLDPRWRPQDGAATRAGFVDGPTLVAERPGASLTLRFSGRAIGILSVSGPDAGTIDCRIDGGAARRVDLFTRWSGRLHLPRCLVLDAELEPGPHSIEIRVADAKHEDSVGHAARIVAFLVNGG